MIQLNWGRDSSIPRGLCRDSQCRSPTVTAAATFAATMHIMNHQIVNCFIITLQNLFLRHQTYFDQEYVGPLLPEGHGAGFKSSQRTVHEPSLGKPGAFRFGAPSQPAAIIATAKSRPPLPGK